MKSTGILFQSDMVRGLLRSIDPKTQTRRIIDPQPFAPLKRCGSLVKRAGHPDETTTELWVDTDPTAHHEMTTCRFGGAGDELWVKETFSRDFANYYPNEPIWYKADDDRSNEIEVRRGVRGIYSPEHKTFAPFKWTPSIFCSRDDSRTTLTIDNIRAQRLQEITEEDAWAEGCKRGEKGDNGRYFPAEELHRSGVGTVGWDCARDWYIDLWNSINAKPQPVYHRDASGNKYINRYVAYPWELDDMRDIKGVTGVSDNRRLKFGTAAYRGKVVFIYPNPYVWAITFHRKR